MCLPSHVLGRCCKLNGVQVFSPWLRKGYDIRPTIAVTKAHIDLPEVREAVRVGRLVPDGKVLSKDSQSFITKVLCTVYCNRQVHVTFSTEERLVFRAEPYCVARAPNGSLLQCIFWTSVALCRWYLVFYLTLFLFFFVFCYFSLFFASFRFCDPLLSMIDRSVCGGARVVPA